MYCLKCGKECAPEHVFCADCMQIMAESPVDPSTPVVLPQRKNTVDKPSRRKSGGYADTVRQLRRIISFLCWVLAVLTLLVCILSGWLIYTLKIEDDKQFTIGQNYTTNQTYP